MDLIMQIWHCETVFDLQKAGLEKEASPQVVQVNFEKVLIISVSILRLTELSLDVGVFLKECYF